jgi:hypothetical protein
MLGKCGRRSETEKLAKTTPKIIRWFGVIGCFQLKLFWCSTLKWQTAIGGHKGPDLRQVPMEVKL